MTGWEAWKHSAAIQIVPESRYFDVIYSILLLYKMATGSLEYI